MNKKVFLIVISIIIAAVAIVTIILLINKRVPEGELWKEYKTFRKEDNNLEARNVLMNILDQNPQNSIALNNLAIDEIQKEHWESALANLQKAKEFAGEYITSDTVTVIALTNIAGNLEVFQILFPGYSKEKTIKAINYNLRKLTK